jgi:DNA-binding MarR family transcriptional regulator
VLGVETLPKVSQTVLAEMIGTTRTRVTYFMNKFKKLGFHRRRRRAEDQQFPLRVVLATD